MFYFSLSIAAARTKAQPSAIIRIHRTISVTLNPDLTTNYRIFCFGTLYSSFALSNCDIGSLYVWRRGGGDKSWMLKLYF